MAEPKNNGTNGGAKNPDDRGTLPEPWSHHGVKQLSDQIVESNRRAGRRFKRLEKRVDDRSKRSEKRISAQLKDIENRLRLVERVAWATVIIAGIIGAIVGYVGVLIRDVILTLMPILTQLVP